MGRKDFKNPSIHVSVYNKLMKRKKPNQSLSDFLKELLALHARNIPFYIVQEFKHLWNRYSINDLFENFMKTYGYTYDESTSIVLRLMAKYSSEEARKTS